MGAEIMLAFEKDTPDGEVEVIDGFEWGRNRLLFAFLTGWGKDKGIPAIGEYKTLSNKNDVYFEDYWGINEAQYYTSTEMLAWYDYMTQGEGKGSIAMTGFVKLSDYHRWVTEGRDNYNQLSSLDEVRNTNNYLQRYSKEKRTYAVLREDQLESNKADYEGLDPNRAYVEVSAVMDVEDQIGCYIENVRALHEIHGEYRMIFAIV